MLLLLMVTWTIDEKAWVAEGHRGIMGSRHKKSTSTNVLLLHIFMTLALCWLLWFSFFIIWLHFFYDYCMYQSCSKDEMRWDMFIFNHYKYHCDGNFFNFIPDTAERSSWIVRKLFHHPCEYSSCFYDRYVWVETFITW